MSKYEKIRLAASRDIPFNKLLLSQSNVRRIKAGVSIEDLAEDIARRGLLQGLSVRPVLAEDGTETGMYEIPAGGRRFRALELLAKQKRFARTALVPCVVREGGLAEEDSLAENVQRAPLLGHVSEVSFVEGSEMSMCLFQAARSAYPKSWRRAAWNKHLRDVDGVHAGEPGGGGIKHERHNGGSYVGGARERAAHLTTGQNLSS